MNTSKWPELEDPRQLIRQAACAREHDRSLIFISFCLPVFPLPIVAVSLVLTGTENYAADNCWLPNEYGIIYWTFVAPVAIIVLVSGVLFKEFISSPIKHFYWYAIGRNASPDKNWS